ncbi:endolytic transglycosylase MltG [Cellulomonas gilvus]|uniref:Endolytic murein transglycosylase n=1 Tax=Cellulomonas gilvus (strain ATCC 13127 / NRRL B-14078) TaxID=593907 RepID=F8A514_CELGA|nr:endolytic transglycosylase MltG [Cellulomonas gilvus]AEI12117.1 aminodeoxychorismate lyase [Cellulomonas gilvus ATCC 13127]
MTDSRIDSRPRWAGSAPAAQQAAPGDAAQPRAEHRPASRRARVSDRERAARERRERRRRSVVVALVVVALFAGAGYVVASALGVGERDTATEKVAAPVLDYPGPGHGSAMVTLGDDETPATIGKALVAAGVVADAKVFVAALAARDGAEVEPGTYRLPLEMPSADAVDALLDPANKASLRVTLAPGLTAAQILAKVSEKTTIPLAELEKAAKDEKAIGLPAEADGRVEGWLYATTYEVEPDATATEVLSQLVGKTIAVLEDKGADEGEWMDVLTAASLVEREAVREEDRPMLARAIRNRIERGQPLEIAASVSYGEGITEPPTDKMTQDSSNPYNTYRHTGLPPSPIASPSESSIDAVLHPDAGSVVFWTPVDLETGELRFASTWDGHQANLDRLRAWQDDHKQ